MSELALISSIATTVLPAPTDDLSLRVLLGSCWPLRGRSRSLLGGRLLAIAPCVPVSHLLAARLFLFVCERDAHVVRERAWRRVVANSLASEPHAHANLPLRRMITHPHPTLLEELRTGVLLVGTCWRRRALPALALAFTAAPSPGLSTTRAWAALSSSSTSAAAVCLRLAFGLLLALPVALRW